MTAHIRRQLRVSRHTSQPIPRAAAITLCRSFRGNHPGAASFPNLRTESKSLVVNTHPMQIGWVDSFNNDSINLDGQGVRYASSCKPDL